MKALRKGIVFTNCLMLVVCLYGEKDKKPTLTFDQMRMEIASAFIDLRMRFGTFQIKNKR